MNPLLLPNNNNPGCYFSEYFHGLNTFPCSLGFLYPGLLKIISQFLLLAFLADRIYAQTCSNLWTQKHSESTFFVSKNHVGHNLNKDYVQHMYMNMDFKCRAIEFLKLF